MLTGIRVTVTGGAGFIGSHLVEALVACKAYVTVIDNLSTGNKDNIKNVFSSIRFIKEDIRNRRAMQKALRDCDIVFHLAAHTSVTQAQENCNECFDINVNGTLSMLEAARTSNCKRFIFASSAAVYGNQSPCSEDMPCKPISHYGTSKLIGENICNYFNTNYALSTTCMRFFNVYGLRQNIHIPYPTITAHVRYAMKHNQPITIYGDGTQKRDFVPVEYVVKALLAVSTAPVHEIHGNIFNVATGRSISTLELIEKLRTEFPHYQQPYTFLPARSGDIYESHAVCTKINNLFLRSL